MKGILGRKVGMTQVFTDHGRSIPVTVIEVKPNVVTKVITEATDGYNAIQLGVEDKKKSRQNKPDVGHFKKANTVPKKFVKEIRNMEGEYTIGQTIDASIFSPGQLVDVIGTSKGKGFAGAIKRHNQSIGPKSHGGGGGSKPVRLTGSLGDIAGNKVIKGMTMPGQMGNQKATQQNLEVIAVDTVNNALLVKGSIPGPKKSFVIVRNAVKLLPDHEAVKLINVNEARIKNELLEEAAKLKVEANSDMSINEIRDLVNAANEAKAAEKAAEQKAKEDAAQAKEESKAPEKTEEVKSEEKVEAPAPTEETTVEETPAPEEAKEASQAEVKKETPVPEKTEETAHQEEVAATVEEKSKLEEVKVEETPAPAEEKPTEDPVEVKTEKTNEEGGDE